MHNAERVIGATLASLIGQERPPHEVIVVDDGSTDRSAEIVQKVATTSPLPLRLLRSEKNIGVARARNLGVTAASGEWLGFCDSDDLWHPELTLRVEAALTNNPDWQAVGVRSFGFASESDRNALVTHDRVGMVNHWTQTEAIDELIKASVAAPKGSGRVFSLEDFARDSCFSTTQVVMSKDAFHLAGGFSPLSHAVDEWLLHAALAAQQPIPELPDPLVFVRIRPGSLSHDRAEAAERVLAVITFLRHGGRIPDQRPAGALYEHLLAFLPIAQAAGWLALGGYKPLQAGLQMAYMARRRFRRRDAS